MLTGKYLNVTLIYHLSWSVHVDNIVRATNSAIGYVRYSYKSSASDIKPLRYETLIPRLLDIGIFLY